MLILSEVVLELDFEDVVRAGEVPKFLLSVLVFELAWSSTCLFFSSF